MGFDWKAFAKLAEIIGPAALAAAGVPPAVIPLAVHGIQLAEKVGGGGVDKKATALDAVNTGIAAVNAASGKQVIDPAVVDVVDEGIDAAVGAINAAKKQPIKVS
jgi:hypothetical protein